MASQSMKFVPAWTSPVFVVLLHAAPLPDVLDSISGHCFSRERRFLAALLLEPARGAPYDNVERSLHLDWIAETYLAAARQHRSAWSWEIELRPSTEVF